MTASVTPLAVELGRETNLNDLLAARVAATPEAVLVERKTGPGGAWQPMTAREFDAHVAAVAKGLVAGGVQPGDRVAIMARTRYEWSLLDWALWAVGAVGVIGPTRMHYSRAINAVDSLARIVGRVVATRS